MADCSGADTVMAVAALWAKAGDIGASAAHRARVASDRRMTHSRQ
jgi:hypothetical protein